MKSLVALVFLMLAAIAQAQAQTLDLTLSWDQNPETDIAGYRVHWGTTSGHYTETRDVGNFTTYKVTGLAQGTTYYFVVTAYNTIGLESLPSEEVSYTTSSAPSPPSGLKPGAQTISVDGSGSVSGVFSVDISRPWRIEQCDDLAAGIWRPFTGTTALGFVDTSASQVSQRFYRAVALQ